MEEQLKQNTSEPVELLKQCILEIVEILKQGGQFILDELPGFVHEYLTYYAWYHAFWAVFGIIGLVVIWGMYVKYNRYRADSNGNWNGDVAIGGAVLACLCSVPVGIPLVHHCISFTKVLMAPRLYLIENLIKLVNQ